MNPGDILDGRYEILARLGAGGMGEVYKAKHTFLGATRVIKVVHPQIARSADARDRFLREAQIATKIQHPNVATLHDFAALPDGSHYMVWEFIDGENLAQRLRARGTFPARQAARIAIEALHGLEAIHRAGIIHRDISPENLMLTPTGAVKIIDLGVAKLEDPDAVSQTRTGIFVGKLRYAAPEQLGFLPEGERIDHRTDLWALAMVLIELLTGRPPYEATSPHEYYLHHAREVTQTNVELPLSLPGARPLQAVLVKALTKDRNQRYAGARELASALEEIERTLPDPDLTSTLAGPLDGDDTAKQVPTDHFTSPEVTAATTLRSPLPGPDDLPATQMAMSPAVPATLAALPATQGVAPASPAAIAPPRRSRAALIVAFAGVLLLLVAGALAFRMQLTELVLPKKAKPAPAKLANAAPPRRPAAATLTVTPPATIAEAPGAAVAEPDPVAAATTAEKTGEVRSTGQRENARPNDEGREADMERAPARVRRASVYVAGLGSTPGNDRALERLRDELRGVTSISLIAGRHQVDVYRTIHRYLPDLEFDAESPVVVKFDTLRSQLGRQLSPLGSTVVVEKNGEVIFRFEAGGYGDAAESFAAVLAEAFD